MGGLPKGWLDYSPVGNRIEGTRFICFKVPFSGDQRQVAEEHKLSPKSLLERIPDLGLVIDLTDTTRYYSPNEFKSKGVEHQKIRIQGHVLPRNNSHKRFSEVVNTFLQLNSDNDKLIGVHCTHGCNRTGLMVCSYLVREGGMSPTDAIQSFQTSRGHEIHRDNYIEAIHTVLIPDAPIERPTFTTSQNYQRLSVANIRNAADQFGTLIQPPWMNNNAPFAAPPPPPQHRDNRQASSNIRDATNNTNQPITDWRQNMPAPRHNEPVGPPPAPRSRFDSNRVWDQSRLHRDRSHSSSNRRNVRNMTQTTPNWRDNNRSTNSTTMSWRNRDANIDHSRDRISRR